MSYKKNNPNRNYISERDVPLEFSLTRKLRRQANPMISFRRIILQTFFYDSFSTKLLSFCVMCWRTCIESKRSERSEGEVKRETWIKE